MVEFDKREVGRRGWRWSKRRAGLEGAVACFGAADATGGTRVLLALLGLFSLTIGLHAVRHVLITIVGPARERTVDVRPWP